jgi:glycerophosphoryl diester phosphodiesterase
VLDRRRRLLFAHRGGAALRPENTIAAFDHGLELGADGLELDVQLSRDGELVVIHDARLERTTDAQGLVSQHTARELAGVDAGYRFEAGRPNGYRGRGIGIPRFADVLQRYPDVPLIVELKGRDPELARGAVRLARSAGAMDRVCFGSFEDDTIRAARACGPDVVTSAGRGEIRRALWASWLGLSPVRPRYRAFQVPERYGLRRVASRRFIRAANRGHLAVQVWTVDDPAAMQRLLGWGAHAIITDRPDIGVAAVRAFNERRP